MAGAWPAIAGRSAADVLLQPGVDGVVPQDAVLRLEHPVVLVGEPQQPRVDATRLQGVVVGQALGVGHAVVQRAVDHQRGRFHALEPFPAIAVGDNRGELARRLHLSERTLQRRLADEGSSYQQLLNDTRRQLAERYLRDGQLAATEIALLLGYSEPSVFFRAFRQWTGLTPGEYRASQQAQE